MDGLDALIRSLSSGSGSPHGASGRAGILGDEDNASKLLWAEFGTVTAPARPTLTRAYDGSEAAAVHGVREGLGRVVDATSRGTVGSPMAALAVAVDDIAEATRGAIRSNTPPPLSDSTIAARQSRGNSSTATLVDTGAMVAAVTSQVNPGADGWGE